MLTKNNKETPNKYDGDIDLQIFTNFSEKFPQLMFFIHIFFISPNTPQEVFYFFHIKLYYRLYIYIIDYFGVN